MTGTITQRRRVSDDGEMRTDPVYLLDGKEVPAAEYFAHFPAAESFAGLIPDHHGAGWPMASDALAVHPDQIAEARESAQKRGVSTDFLPDGRPVFTDPAHRLKYLKRYGFHARNSYGTG